MAKVLDSWALMAWVKDEEPAASQVEDLLDAGEARQVDLLMSMINVGEVYYLLRKQRGPPRAEKFWDDIQTLPVRIVGAPNDLILEAARFKSQYPISYADAFAVATAVRERATLVTGDLDFKALSEANVVEIEWLGRRVT